MLVLSRDAKVISLLRSGFVSPGCWSAGSRDRFSRKPIGMDNEQRKRTIEGVQEYAANLFGSSSQSLANLSTRMINHARVVKSLRISLRTALSAAEVVSASVVSYSARITSEVQLEPTLSLSM
jgi:phenylacetate-coenzyme A ligase PaaK-like adenylate-forming protein